MLALVERLNLNPLQGRAAVALRAIQGTFPPALRNTAAPRKYCRQPHHRGQNSQRVPGRSRHVERQAAAATAHHQAVQAQPAAMPRGSIVLTDDLQSASATVNGIHKQAQELHQRYLAAASKTAEGVEEHSGLWDETEPVRKVLEPLLAPLDIAAADHWVSVLKEVAGVPSEGVKEVDEKIEEVEKLRARENPSPKS